MSQALKLSIFVLALALAGCPPPEVIECIDGTEPTCPDAGGPPPDFCNTPEEAKSDPQCALTLGQARQAFISYSGDDDWYLAQLPGNLTPRSLIHLKGGYAAPNTAVNLAVNLLRGDAQQSLARVVDRHGQAAPRPVDVVLPFSESNASLLVLVQDEGAGLKPNFDAKSPYSVTVEVLENPDPNEPNDTTPTVIDLASQGAILAGQQTGYLATNDDVDKFSITAPAGRKVLYLRISAPKLSPAPQYRMSYVLLDPTNKPISEGRMDNEFLPVELATARLTTAGAYSLVVQGYRSVNTTGPVPGDVRLEYTVEVKIMDEVDPNEPNDTLLTARRATGLTAPGTSHTFTGRLGYVADLDFYLADLPATNAPTVLYYRVTPTTAAGRFPQLPGRLDRQIRVVREVTGGNAAQNQQTCLTDRSVCPQSFRSSDDYTRGLVETACNVNNPPRCLWSSREEHVEFTNWRNFEGAIPVPPHPGGSLKVILLFEDDANDFADDKDYTLTVEWRADPDEAAKFAGGATEQTTVLSMPQISPSGFPVPGSGSASVSGTLSHGLGLLLRHDPNEGDGVFGPEDYDAVITDADSYQFTLPTLDPDAGYMGRSWALQWQVAQADGGTPPFELGVGITFCNGDVSTTSCSSVSRPLSYTGSSLASWHNRATPPLTPYQPVYDRSSSGGATTTTARAYGCFCFEPRFMRGGKFTMKVQAADRVGYANQPYTIRTALTDYPQAFPLAAGGSASCPAPVDELDGGYSGGCRFTQ